MESSINNGSIYRSINYFSNWFLSDVSATHLSVSIVSLNSITTYSYYCIHIADVAVSKSTAKYCYDSITTNKPIKISIANEIIVYSGSIS